MKHDSPNLIGRERELDLLRARLTSARSGRGQVVLVAGEPGIGKSRLAEEAVCFAGALGMAGVWGRALDDDGCPPFWPFRSIVRALATEGADPWPAPTTAGDSAGAPLDLLAQERFRLFEAITHFLLSAAGDDGLLLVVDDLQWADTSSLRLLVHLTRAIGAAPVAIVATYRDTEVGQRDALKQALADLARESPVTRLRLVGLTEAEVAAHLAELTGARVDDQIAGIVSRRSQGNPFFIGELAGVLGEVDCVADAEQILPEGVRDAVHARLARLGEHARSVVAAAAVLGSPPDVGQLARITGNEPGEVLRALDHAASSGVLKPVSWAFVHDLVRDAARSELPRATRLDAHRRIAEYLQEQPDAEARPAELAHHWLESLPLGDRAQAVRWADRAGQDASSQCSWEEAAEFYRRAAEVADDPVRQGELRVAGATAYLRAYRMSSARESVLEAARLARGLGDGALLARAALVMEGMNDLTWSDTERGLCEEALALLPDEDSVPRARLLAQLSVDQLMVDRPDRSAELSGAALAMADRLDDRVALRSALHARQLARGGPDGVHDRVHLSDRFVAYGIEDNDAAAELWGRLWRFDALMQLGDLDGADRAVVSIAAVVTRLRLPLATWHLLRCQAAIAMARGRLTVARTYGERALTLARRGDHLGGLLPSQGFLAMLGMLTGFRDESESKPLEGWEHVPSLHGMMAMVHWYAGREDLARRAYATAQPIDEIPGFLLMAAVPGLIELAEAFEDHATLDAAYRALAPYADLFCCGGAGVVATTGSAHGALGVAAAALGRVDDGVRHLRTAIGVNERAGAVPFAAIARFDLARTLARRRRTGDTAEASALTAQAAATARELGMAPLLSRTDTLAAMLAGQTPGPLTRREREIAELVGQGLTNRQIAAATHIAERTAESHVAHILTKLGFTTRAQIAAWVVRDGR